MGKRDKAALGNQDEREKARKLSKAEERRLQAFEELAARMEGQGYRRVELTVSIVGANVFAVALLVPVAIVGVWLFLLVNSHIDWEYDSTAFLGILLAFVVLIVAHELIHGASWAIFAEHHLKDIEFGFMVQYLTPYCTCTVPLSKGQYVFGALMPLVLVGIVPMAAGIAVGSAAVMFIGVLMVVSAAGDIMVVWNILRYRTQAAEVVYLDHPTQAGGVIFER